MILLKVNSPTKKIIGARSASNSKSVEAFAREIKKYEAKHTIVVEKAFPIMRAGVIKTIFFSFAKDFNKNKKLFLIFLNVIKLITLWIIELPFPTILAHFFNRSFRTPLKNFDYFFVISHNNAIISLSSFSKNIRDFYFIYFFKTF